MIALRTWVPPRWLHPSLAFAFVVAVMATAGYIYTPSLIVVWPMAGAAAIAFAFISGCWNDGDPLSGQAFLGVMHFIVPPLVFAMWIGKLQYDRRQGFKPIASDVPVLSVAGAIGISLFGLAVFAGSLVLLALLVWS
jgi:hypothetical protein